MTSEATTAQIPDVYGQLHPVETVDLIERKRTEFEQELRKLSTDVKTSLSQAEDKCPGLVTEDFKLKFLRCEVFNADLAAKRYVHYWDKRVEIFGPEKAFQPLTLSEALSEDDGVFDLGVMTLPGSKDPSGRSLIYYDPANLDKTKYTTNAMVRTFWYVLHAALEHEETQKHGLIVLVDPGRARFSQFDRSIGKLFMASMSGALPIRVAAIHIVHPPSFINLILPLVKLFMPERMRKRIRFHNGSEEVVLANLKEKFGLSSETLPKQVGGSLTLDHKAWLNQRRESGL